MNANPACPVPFGYVLNSCRRERSTCAVITDDTIQSCPPFAYTSVGPVVRYRLYRENEMPATRELGLVIKNGSSTRGTSRTYHNRPAMWNAGPLWGIVPTTATART